MLPDGKRVHYSIVVIAGSKEQPGHKLRCPYGLLKGLDYIQQLH